MQLFPLKDVRSSNTLTRQSESPFSGNQCPARGFLSLITGTYLRHMCPHFAAKFQPFRLAAAATRRDSAQNEHTMNTRPPPPSHPPASNSGVAGANGPWETRIGGRSHTDPHLASLYSPPREEESMTHTCEEGADDAAALLYSFFYLSLFLFFFARPYRVWILIREEKRATVLWVFLG